MKRLMCTVHSHVYIYKRGLWHLWICAPLIFDSWKYACLVSGVVPVFAISQYVLYLMLQCDLLWSIVYYDRLPTPWIQRVSYEFCYYCFLLTLTTTMITCILNNNLVAALNVFDSATAIMIRDHNQHNRFTIIYKSLTLLFWWLYFGITKRHYLWRPKLNRLFIPMIILITRLLYRRLLVDTFISRHYLIIHCVCVAVSSFAISVTAIDIFNRFISLVAVAGYHAIIVMKSVSVKSFWINTFGKFSWVQR